MVGGSWVRRVGVVVWSESLSYERRVRVCYSKTCKSARLFCLCTTLWVIMAVFGTGVVSEGECMVVEIVCCGVLSAILFARLRAS